MKPQFLIICLFFIIGFTPKLDAQIESIKWGEENYKYNWTFDYCKYFIGKTDEHFYYISSLNKENILRKFNYEQEEIYSKELNLSFNEKKLGLYSLTNSNGKTYAMLRDGGLNMKMNFYISEFKDDEFGEIYQPYNVKEFEGFDTPYIQDPELIKYSEEHVVKQNPHNNRRYHQQSGNGKYFAIIGNSGFNSSNEKKLGIVVLNENMKAVWQKTIDLGKDHFTHIPQFHVANNGDIFIILAEKKDLPEGYATGHDNKLLHITKDAHNFISFDLNTKDVVADLGFFNSEHENEIYLAGIYESPDVASIGKYQAFEGLFLFKYNTKTKEEYTRQNNIPINTKLSINHLVKTENNEFFLKLENSNYYYNDSYSGNIYLYKLDNKGNKTHEQKIYHRINLDHTPKVMPSLMAFHNDKIHLVYSNNIEKSTIKKGLWKYMSVRNATLDMNLEFIADKQSIYRYKENKYFFIPLFSFTHENKIVLCNIGIGIGKKMKFITLNLK